MNKKIRVGNRSGVMAITDKMYFASGGEAAVYVSGGKTFKMYHDPHKTLPEKKMKELAVITNPQVITPH